MSLMDAAALLGAAVKAAEEKRIGWLDADQPLNEFRKRMNILIDVDKTCVESALSCLQELDELKRIPHPDGLNTETFIKKITPPGQVYNKRYRVFERGKKK